MTDATFSPAAVAAPARPLAGYRRGLDIGRITAAFFIVWDHAHAPGWQIGYLALALFLFLTSFLAVQSYERRPGPGFWRKRAVRLLMPWLFWCAFYRVIYEILSDAPFQWLSDPYSLITGPYFHLWFLPFTAVWLVLIPPMSRLIQSQTALAAAMILLVAVSVPLGTVHAGMAFELPVVQWAFSLPLFLLGGFHAIALRLGAGWMSWVAATAISAVLVALYGEFWGAQALLALIVFEVLWRLPIKATWPTFAAGYAFGVYLLHPFFMLVAYKVFGVEVNPIPAALFTFACTLVATEIIHRTPFFNRFA